MTGLDAGRVLFRADANAGHRLDRLDRVFAGSAFGRKHHGIGVVEDRVGYIGHLGACRHRAVDHRLHHLRRGDHHLVVATCMQNDLLLDATSSASPISTPRSPRATMTPSLARISPSRPRRRRPLRRVRSWRSATPWSRLRHAGAGPAPCLPHRAGRKPPGSRVQGRLRA